MTIINRNIGLSAGMSVDRSAFETLIPNRVKEEPGGSYGYAIRGCLASAKALAKKAGWTDPIAISIASRPGTAGLEHDIRRVIEQNDQEACYHSVLFERRTDLPPLQAADIVVYEMCKEVARILGIHQREQRRSLARVFEKYPYWGYMDREEVAKFLELNRKRILSS